LRHKRNLGARRIQSELQRLHDISLAVTTIRKVLTKHKVIQVKHLRNKSEFIRDKRLISNDLVQMDTTEIALGL